MSITVDFLNLRIIVARDNHYQRSNNWKLHFDKWIVSNKNLWKSLLKSYTCENELWYYICHPDKKPNDFVCNQCGKVVPYSVWNKHFEKNPVYYCNNKCLYEHRKISYFKKTGLINPGQLRKSPEKIYYENHLNEFICELCGKQLSFKNNNKLCSRCYSIKAHKAFVENYYKNPNYCKCCGNVILFEKRTHKTCSKECGRKMMIEKSKETMLKRYGVEHALQNKEFKEKAVQTSIKRYGVKNASSSKIIRERVKNTMVERYGVDNARKIDSVVEKTKQTLLNKYGVDCPFSIDKELKIEKAVDTKMKKYGTLTMGSHRFKYDNIRFDSKEELYFYIYNHDILRNGITRGNIFEYNFEGKIHKYFCDFKIGEKNIEIKGGHLMNENGLYFPYLKQNKVDSSVKQKLYDAKYECMLKNNVKIILTKSSEMQKIISKVNSIYGKDYIDLFALRR